LNTEAYGGQRPEAAEATESYRVLQRPTEATGRALNCRRKRLELQKKSLELQKKRLE